jgi:hypothetical protein
VIFTKIKNLYSAGRRFKSAPHYQISKGSNQRQNLKFQKSSGSREKQGVVARIEIPALNLLGSVQPDFPLNPYFNLEK